MAKAKASVKRRSAKAASASSNGHADASDITSLGGQLKVTNTTTVELTHDLAHELLAMPAFTAERPLRKKHVADLVKHMERGTFHWNLVTVITCRCREAHDGQPSGTEFRMNGQHTCQARLHLAGSVRSPVKMVRYSAETQADLRRLYSTIDRGAPRTRSNVIASYIVGTDQFKGCPANIRKVLAPGMSMWKWESHHERQSHDSEDIAYLLLKEERSLVSAIVNFLAPLSLDDTKHLRRAPVVAAMLETFCKSPEHAGEFWISVATGLDIKSASDPRKRLHKLLLTTAVMAGAGAHNKARLGTKVLAGEAMYRVCIGCWNAWREGRDVSTLRVPSQRLEAVA